MRILKWLYPGMGVKRWIGLAGLGILIVVGAIVNQITEYKYFNNSFINIATLLFGCFLIIISGRKAFVSIVTVFVPHKDNLVDIVYQKRHLERGPRIVVIGGGTGLSTMLHGLKQYTSNITAIVTVADDGGSSGRLRKEFDVLPPGDIRNCLVALADRESLMQDLFQFRFESDSALSGHSFGNLFLTAMTKVTGDFEKAIKESSQVLAIRGQVIPSTLEKITLVAEYYDGSFLEGESNFRFKDSPIKRVSLKPSNPVAPPETLRAIMEAEAIVLGPGSLYTSIIPNLLVKNISQAIIESKALKIYVCNAMTQAGETANYKASDHIRAIIEHSHPKIIGYCILNTKLISKELLDKYSKDNSFPVEADINKIKSLGYKFISDDIISTKDFIRHDTKKLARIIISLIEEKA
ncbi:MAG: YvcK family protein [Candidatus Omnitrophota bacterium]